VDFIEREPNAFGAKDKANALHIGLRIKSVTRLAARNAAAASRVFRKTATCLVSLPASFANSPIFNVLSFMGGTINLRVRSRVNPYQRRSARLNRPLSSQSQGQKRHLCRR
jgi:hypothetical protein